MGIDSFNWYNRFENGVIETGGGLELTPRGMVKIGVTFLNNGVWNGQQVISEQWVGKSSISYRGNNGIDVPGTDKKNVGYSYSWWTKTFSDSGKEINMFYAGGWGGQNVFVFPDLNTVIVTTGGTYTSSTRTMALLEKYVIPAFN